MATIYKDGIKFGKTFWPYAEYEECATCRFVNHVDEVDGQVVDRDICKMPAEFEDEFLFNDIPADQIPPCFEE